MFWLLISDFDMFSKELPIRRVDCFMTTFLFPYAVGSDRLWLNLCFLILESDVVMLKVRSLEVWISVFYYIYLVVSIFEMFGLLLYCSFAYLLLSDILELVSYFVCY